MIGELGRGPPDLGHWSRSPPAEWAGGCWTEFGLELAL